jgi:hypothetical protein
MGHADREIGNLYSKMEDEAEFCQTVADSVGLGFELPKKKLDETPDVAPIAPKTECKEKFA